jgi:hypothetical protein
MNHSIGFSNLEIHETTEQYNQEDAFKPPTMSSSEHQQQHGDVGVSGSQQPSFNPILSHQGQQSLGNSVVPDLMKVYESLTQSSTPPDGLGGSCPTDSASAVSFSVSATAKSTDAQPIPVPFSSREAVAGNVVQQ